MGRRERRRQHDNDFFKRFEILYADLYQQESNKANYIKTYNLEDIKVKVNQLCMIISEVLKSEGYVISEMSVYRILKIKEKSIDYYNKIKTGELKINEAYDKCFNIKKRKHSTPPEIQPKDYYVLLDDIDNEINRRKNMGDTLGSYSEQFELIKKLKNIKSRLKD